MGHQPQYVIEAKNLKKAFGDFLAANDISYNLGLTLRGRSLKELFKAVIFIGPFS